METAVVYTMLAMTLHEAPTPTIELLAATVAAVTGSWSLVGNGDKNAVDGAAVDARFTAFAQKYPLTSTQLRFLDMLKEHIALAGSIRLEQLFKAPFTRIHDEGITGVFALDSQLDELIGIVRSFGDPATLENRNA